jgi:LysM repeat protein
MSFSQSSHTPQSNAQYYILPTSDSERNSINSNRSANTSKKSNYGSLRQDSKTQQTANAFIVNYEHKIEPGDTLLGISLKYNLPIESIKRANRLWNNDLFLKDKLIIPLDKEKLKSLNLTMNKTDLKLNVSSQEVEQSSNETKNTTDGNTDNEMNKTEYKDFLNKFDSFINESKLKLKTLETQNSNQAIAEYLNNTEKYNQNNSDDNNNLYRDDDIFSRNDALFKDSINSRRNNDKNNQKGENSSISSASSSNLSSLQRSSNSNLASNNIGQNNENMVELMITSPNKFTNYYGSNHNLISGSTDGSSDRAKMAKENLQRLEREKDDLYEL